MIIYCANDAYLFESFSDGSKAYLPMTAESSEVPDLWYEKRQRPKSTLVIQSKVYHPDLPIPTGQYSALCHVKFLNEAYFSPATLPADQAPTNKLGYYNSTSRTFEWTEEFVQHITPFGPSYTLFDYQYLDGGLVAIVWGSISTSKHPSHTGIDVGVYVYYIRDVHYRSYYGDYRIDYGYLNCGTSFLKLPPEKWTVSAAHSEMLYLAFKAEYGKTPAEWSSTYGTHPKAETHGSIDYVKDLAVAAQISALRYNDLELVDWSFGPYSTTPWAMSNTDFLMGRAASYVSALEDIPNECDNQLQNIVAVVCALEALASGTSKLFSKWLDFQGFKSESNFVKAAAKKNWYQTNARGLTRLQELKRRFDMDVKVVLDKTLLDEFFAAKRDAFGDVSSAWLQGRYVFSTSVMDLGQSWDYWYERALHALRIRSSDYKIHGIADLEQGKFQCSALLREKALRGITKCFEAAYRHGLEPNAYVLWDFVPFSFVVDWFYPIGDSLLGYVRSCHFTPELWEYVPVYDGNALCYSVAYTSQSPMFGEMSVYTRWYELSPPDVEPAYILQAEWQSIRNVIPRRVTTDDEAATAAKRASNRFDRDARRVTDIIALL